MSIRVSIRRLAAVGALALAAAVPAGAAASAAAPPSARRGPAGAAFYSPRRLPAGPHGTLIWSRPLHGIAALRGARNWLVLYKQVGIHGREVPVSGIVSVPKGRAPRGGWPVITFAHGTTGIADQCAPSRATSASSDAGGADAYVAPLLGAWIRAGYAVVRTDYEGLGTPGPHPYLIGSSEGRSVLDIVTAARELDPALGNRVVISGHSQGGHAALWAAALAPRYAPALRVLGTLAFAPASHLAQETSLLNQISSTALTPLAAVILRGVQIADPSLGVPSLLTPAASKLFGQTLTQCLSGLSAPSSFGGLPLDQLVLPNANLGPVERELAANDPGRLHIHGQVVIEQGLADTTVLPPFDQQLAKELAGNGARVTYRTWPGVTHIGVVTAALGDSLKVLHRWFHP